MTPSARIEAASAILDAWLAERRGLAPRLARWGRENRYAGGGDRRAIGDLCYDAVRRLRSAAWTAAGDAPVTGRRLMIGLARQGEGDLERLFAGGRHGAPALTAAEGTAGAPLAEAPVGVRLDLPDWLAERIAPERHGDWLALRERAPIDLRVNTLKTDREGAVRALAEQGVEAVPVPLSPTALRVVSGGSRLRASRALADGLVEPQDAASQAVADLCRARPGEAVLDHCAGAGGKTLALAAAMGGEGRLVAHDADPRRMTPLAERAERAGAVVEIRLPGTLPEGRWADLVLVDAPCSGSGSWRRDPEAKWRLTPRALAGLRMAQLSALETAAGHVRDGGRLVYATCSMLDCENEAVRARFLRGAARRFRPVEEKLIKPKDGGDGFFCSVLEPAGG